MNAANIMLEGEAEDQPEGGRQCDRDRSRPGVTIIGTIVKINSGGAGDEVTGNADIEDPEDAAASDTGEPGWLEKHKGGPGGGRKRRQLDSPALHRAAASRREPAKMTAMRNRLNQTPTGRNAMYVYDRDNVQFVDGVAGQGTFYTPPDGEGGGNTVTIDPN